MPGSSPKHLAHGRPWGRSGLDDHVLVGVVQRFPHLVEGRVGVEGGGGAAVDALAAIDADDLGQRLVQEGGDLHLVRAVHGLEHAHFLHVDAGADAAAAADALVHVADDRVAGVVDCPPASSTWPKRKLSTPYSSASCLQFAVAVADARIAVAAVLAQQQVEDVAAGDAHGFGVGLDLDGRRDRIGAGRLEVPLTLHLDHADAADAGHFEVGVIAEGGDAHPDALGGLEDGGAQRHFGLHAVDGHRDGRADSLGEIGSVCRSGWKSWLSGARRRWQTGVIGHGSRLQNARGWKAAPPSWSDPGRTWRLPAWCWRAL